MIATPDRLDELWAAVAAHLCFCCRRTVSDVLPGAPEQRRFGRMFAVRDLSRPERGDLQRIVGATGSDPAQLEAALDFMAGLDAIVEVPAPEVGPALSAQLSARGFRPSEGAEYLLLAPAEVPPPSGSAPGLRRLSADEVDRLFDLMERDAAPIPEPIRAARRDLHCTSTYRTWVAELDGAPVAFACLYVHAEGGLLTGANTLPAYRRAGLQRALIDARLADARELGLRWLATDMRSGSSSWRNSLRAGFGPAASVTFWTRDTAG